MKVKKCNHSLSFVLQNCEPREIKEGRLSLVFKYKFHHNRVNDPAIKGLVESTLSEVFGHNLGFAASVDESLKLNSEEEAVSPVEDNTPSAAAMESESRPAEVKPAGGLMADLLKTFGGEVIN